MNVDDGQGMVGGGRGLTNYMSREGNTLKNAAGREMDETELNAFHKKCDRNDFARQFVLAPKRSDLTEEELSRAARESMNEWAKDKDTLEYCYSVHNDQGNNHVHVAMTATEESGDLWLDGIDEVHELQDEIAADRFQDHTTKRQQQMLAEQDREDELAQEQAALSLDFGDGRDRDRDQEDGVGLVQTLQIGSDMLQKSRETEQQQTQQHDNDRGRSR